MLNKITIGAFIKSKRKEKGYTLEQVGNYVGVSKATVSRWESNEIGNMRTDKVEALCEFLEITTKEFLERSSSINKVKETKQITPRQLHFEVKELVDKTINISDQEKTLLLQTIDFVCSSKE